MRVLHITSEAVPFAKTGGLGDVGGALPVATAELGMTTAVVLPYYSKVRKHAASLTRVLGSVECPYAGGSRPFSLWQGFLSKSPRVPIWFVRNEGVFETSDDLYGTEPGSYGDGHTRFLYFAEAAIRVAKATGFRPDVFHLHDWQASLVAPLLRTRWKHDADLSKAATLLTIHNLAYQGDFSIDDLRAAGIPQELLREGRLLVNGRGNLLAGGIRMVDGLTTVSRTYAREILRAEFGNGLEGVIATREGLLDGIVNGLDVDAWNPETDRKIAARYSAEAPEGKVACRSALLAAYGLKDRGGPVFGAVARLVAQKGLDLLSTSLPAVLRERPDIRVVVLGTGDRSVERALLALARTFPDNVAVDLRFDDGRAHVVEAGADFFLMPSRFEPCGLNQLISMRYGTPPIVRATGGLVDTVIDANAEHLGDGTATGILFRDATAAALEAAIRRAIDLHDRGLHVAMSLEGMRGDWSWTRSARDYAAAYARARERRAGGSLHLADVLPTTSEEPTTPWLPPLVEIPDHHPRDVLWAVPRDPWTLYACWELGGDASRRRLAAIDPSRRDDIRYILRLIERATRTFHDIDVGGLAKEWMADVEPGRGYDVELLMRLPGESDRLLLAWAPPDQPPVPPSEAAIA